MVCLIINAVEAMSHMPQERATWSGREPCESPAYLRRILHHEGQRFGNGPNEARQRVSALAYVVDRGHVQYAGRLSLAEQLRYVRQGHGQSGVNREYVLSTVAAIEAEGFRDPQLHQLAMMLHEG
jgi:cation transport regulator ChaC